MGRGAGGSPLKEKNGCDIIKAMEVYVPSITLAQKSYRGWSRRRK